VDGSTRVVLKGAFNTENAEGTEKREEKSRFLAALGMTKLGWTL